jgi:hypothetical protein
MSPAVLFLATMVSADASPLSEGGGQVAEFTAAPPRWSFAAMPLFNFSSDTGVGFGARAKIERLAGGVAPYWLSLEAQAYGSTGGTQLHFLSADLPSIAGSGWRLDALGGYWRNVAAHYYGVGDHPLLSDAAADTYVESAPILRARARRRLASSLSVQLGYRWMWQKIDAAADSRLQREAPFGVSGGSYSEVALGIAWDTRDDELVPSRGVLLETSVRSTLQALGSRGNSIALFSSAAVYQPVGAGWVFAARFAVDAAWGDIPFDRQGDFGTLVSPFLVVAGIGGGLSVRGLLQSEYVGKLKLVNNAELRFPLFGFQVFGEHLALSGVAFVDAGQVDLGALRIGAGGGLRIRWGKFFIVRFDAGYAEDRVRFYADFGHVF